jgi:hypothetical protein
MLSTIRTVTRRVANAASAIAVLAGIAVFFGLAMPALRDGRTGVGVAVAVCAALGVLLGGAGFIAQDRAGHPRR